MTFVHESPLGSAQTRRIAVVGFPAELDIGTVDQPQGEALLLLERGVSGLVLDFSGTVFCDLSGSNAVFRIEHRARAMDAAVQVAVPPASQPRRLFDLLDLTTTLTLRPSLTASLAGFTALGGAPLR